MFGLRVPKLSTTTASLYTAGNSWMVPQSSIVRKVSGFDWETILLMGSSWIRPNNRAQLQDFRLCRGFRAYVPGRPPAEHLKLEDESRLFWHQRWIAGLAFLGALLGALIGHWLGR